MYFEKSMTRDDIQLADTSDIVPIRMDEEGKDGIQAMKESCPMPIRNWKPAMNRFTIEYEGRFHS